MTKNKSQSLTKKSTKKFRKMKKMRKSSLSKVQKNFKIFHDMEEQLNKYESLVDMNESVETKPDTLESNRDFIAFSASSEDDTADEQIDESIESQDSDADRSENEEFPWLLNHDHSTEKQVNDWLTSEITDFVRYISPSKEEINLRNTTISKVRAAVKDLWSDSNLHVFGSYATDLYLPGSDIDCVVTSTAGDKEDRNYLYSLASHLRHMGLAIKIEVIAKARVPIIKFVEPNSNLHIDVSFERNNGLDTAKLIREWLNDTVGLRELTLIIKQFLASRRLNNVHTGGLGGFSIICLVYTFLRLHPKILTNEIDAQSNLGVLLIEFFELYGKHFGYDDVALSILDGRPSYIPKSEFKQLNPVRTTFALAIQDPGDPYNNISRGSFNLRDIKRAFSSAYDQLTTKCFEMNNATFKDRLGQSILGNVIKYRGKKRNFKDERDVVKNKAIIENQIYHEKRKRVVHEEVFVNLENDSDLNIEEEGEIYRIENLPKKKAKKSKIRSVNPVKLITKKTAKQTPLTENDSVPQLSKTKNISVDALMGLNYDSDSTLSNALNEKTEYIEIGSNTSDDNLSQSTDIKNKNAVDKLTVNARTRREYWLSKGIEMNPINTT